MPRTCRALGSAALLAVLLAAPVSARQWYEHYERGLELADAGECTAALAELEAAARLEPQPHARVRTYGTRFLFAYDPAFHRARCLVELGQEDEARRLLEESRRAGVTPRERLDALAARLERQNEPSVGPPAAPVTPSSNPAVVADPAPDTTEPQRGAPEAPRQERPLTSPSPIPASEAPALDPAEPAERPRTEPAATATEAVSAEPRARDAEARGIVAPPSIEAQPADSGAETSRESASAAGSSVDEPTPLWPWALVAAAVAGGAWYVLRSRRPRPSELDPRLSSSQWHLRLLGSHLGGYELEGEIGRGGMATTFRARRAGDGRTVALKVPHPTGDPTYLERFVREGKLGEALHHPAIVRIFEAGSDRGVPFLAMELLAGRTLRAEMDAHREGLPLHTALRLTRSLAEALDYAHGKGVVHRDLKPENVMLLPDGALKVMDFGVARLDDQPGLTSSQLFLGSPVYSAPEAVESRRVDRRSDLYSLGVLLFEMLEGKPPFVHESVFKLLELHQREPLPDPKSLQRPLPAPVWALITRLCAKEPEDRFPSAQALLVELGRIIEGEGAAARVS